jgi:hypothetical protein
MKKEIGDEYAKYIFGIGALIGFIIGFSNFGIGGGILGAIFGAIFIGGSIF